MQAVDEDAPSHLLLPTGTSVPVCYDGEAPSAAVRLQEVFGLQQTPLLGGAARVRLVLQLLSPAGRPLQVCVSLPACLPACLPAWLPG
jgi:ATP-dependent helicase HrpB